MSLSHRFSYPQPVEDPEQEHNPEGDSNGRAREALRHLLGASDYPFVTLSCSLYSDRGNIHSWADWGERLSQSPQALCFVPEGAEPAAHRALAQIQKQSGNRPEAHILLSRALRYLREDGLAADALDSFVRACPAWRGAKTRALSQLSDYPGAPERAALIVIELSVFAPSDSSMNISPAELTALYESRAAEASDFFESLGPSCISSFASPEVEDPRELSLAAYLANREALGLSRSLKLSGAADQSRARSPKGL